MKSLPPSLQSHLATGATTLAWCWRVTRNDGTAFGFTDHDRDLAFDGTTFEAATGFTASEIKDALGLSVDNLEVSSALKSDRLNEDDLAAGLYDDAAVEIWRVNWADTGQRVLMRSGSLGEVSRSGAAFTAEVRGLAHYLQQPKGRLFQSGCDADLGDARCSVDLDDPAFRGTGTVLAAASLRQFTVSGLDTFDPGWFTRGLVTFTSGANALRSQEVKRHTLSGTTATIELWQPMALAIAPGDTFTITAGCDKQFATCQAKFANAINFRGFPHNQGVTGAARLLQEAVGAEIDGEIGPETLGKAAARPIAETLALFAEARRRHYRSLPTFWRFGKGWLIRVDRTLEAARAIAHTQPSPSPAQQQEQTPMTDTTENPVTPPSPDTKWWGQSMTIWGVIITTLSTVLPAFGPLLGLDVTAELVRQLGDQIVVIVQAVGGLIGTILTIWGRARATTTLERKQITMNM